MVITYFKYPLLFIQPFIDPHTSFLTFFISLKMCPAFCWRINIPPLGNVPSCLHQALLPFNIHFKQYLFYGFFSSVYNILAKLFLKNTYAFWLSFSLHCQSPAFIISLVNRQVTIINMKVHSRVLGTCTILIVT